MEGRVWVSSRMRFGIANIATMKNNPELLSHKLHQLKIFQDLISTILGIEQPKDGAQRFKEEHIFGGCYEIC